MLLKIVQITTNLSNNVANLNSNAKMYIGIFLALKKKGLITDEDVESALNDERAKGNQESGVRPEEAGGDASNSGDEQQRVQPDGSSDSDKQSEGDANGPVVQQSDAQAGNIDNGSKIVTP